MSVADMHTGASPMEREPISSGQPMSIESITVPYELMPLPPDDSEGAKIWAENITEAYRDIAVERGMGEMRPVRTVDGVDTEAFFPDTNQIRGHDLRRLRSALEDVRGGAFDYMVAQGDRRPVVRDDSRDTARDRAAFANLNLPEVFVERTNGTTPRYVDDALVMAGLAGSTKIRALQRKKSSTGSEE
jgi:hypothetical protein